MPAVSVVMPTYKQAGFIRRALDSLDAQSFSDWELVIINDGSPDDTAAVVAPYLENRHIRYLSLTENIGLGAALNLGLEHCQAPLVAYLPSDDVYYRDHLASLVSCLQAAPQAVLAYAGVRHHYNRLSQGQVEGYPLQLVQVIHRRVDERWVERQELTTDDLDRMLWSKLRSHGAFIPGGRLTCEWVDHPDQRHKRVREPIGGVNPYRQYYEVHKPLRFHTTQGNRIDEVERYQGFRQRPDTPLALDGLKILMVGELAYNAERVLALEERGHQLYGLWMPDPYWYNTVGPLPFGHVTDLPAQDWQSAIRRIQPDVIYALLNWQAVPFAYRVMQETPGVPFVWHFKEGPFICLEKGSWRELMALQLRSDGQIYSSPEMRDWFETALPGSVSRGQPMVLDGDLPKSDWFFQPRSTRLSEQDGELHTVVPGRPIGLHPQDVVELAEQGIHLHFYGDFTHGQWREWIEKTKRLAHRHIHLHSQVDQENWVSEFSLYDAGWLHYFQSENAGELRRANWDDLNYPARLATLAVSGLPALQRENSGHIVATQSLARQFDIGVFFSGMEELKAELSDQDRLAAVRENVWANRTQFMFDTHADRLVGFFRQVIAGFTPRRNGVHTAQIKERT